MTPEGRATPSQVTILLVEDNPGDARLMEEMLKDVQSTWAETSADTPDSVELVHGTTLAEGIELLENRPVDVVLIDLGLPDSSGLDTLRAVLDVTEAVPVLVLTGLPEEELGIDAVREGAQDYLVKGDVNVDTFAHEIQYALERKRTEQELRRTTRQLTILNQLMRHDIRNDVSLVVGRTQELTEYVDPRGEELLAEVITASNHVLQLTRTIGDAVEAITTPEEVELEPVDLTSVLEDEIANARRLYGADSIAVEDDLPQVSVRAGHLLSAVFGNLISNAMLYAGDDGGARVDVDVDEETATVRIADRGPGIPDHRKEQIFSRDDAEAGAGADSEGLGIGLFLVDQLVRQYRGDVWVEDNEPQGSIFHVSLERA